MGNEVSIASQLQPSSNPIPLPWVDPQNLSEVVDTNIVNDPTPNQSESIEIKDGKDPELEAQPSPKDQVISFDTDYITPEIRVTQPSPVDRSFEEDEIENENGVARQKHITKSLESDDNYDGAELVSFIFPPEEEKEKDKDQELSDAVENAEVETEQRQWAEEVEAEAESEDDEEEEDSEGGHKTYGIRFFSPKDVRTAKLVGEGGFGRVLKGFLHGTPVAIKLFHAPIDLNKVQKELEVLMTLKHRCIVGIFGIVEQTEGIDCPQVILQNYSEGNVLEYLSWKENPEDNGTLGKFAFDVIEGCQYLQRKGIVHGNLAARNILVEKLIARNKIYYNAKVSDMGIIRFADPTGGNYMKLFGSGKIVPVRWVPKEIVGDDEEGIIGSDFTFESDVWSFGVVLWELWTRGATPYGASYSNLRVLQFIREGYSPLKIHRPSECPAPVVTVMESIFKVDPKERPTFNQLHEKFRSYKGYGKDIRPNKKKLAMGAGATSAAAAAPATYEKKQSYSGGEAEPTSPKMKTFPPPEKAEKKKKKKSEKKVKAKALSGAGPSSIPSRVVYNTSFGINSEPEEFPAPPPIPMTRSRSSEEDATIQALLARVNQLENERMGRGGGVSSVLNQEHWKRRLGPPRYHRHSNNYNDYGDMGGAVGIAGGHAIPPPQQSTPPPSQAPPPYTESPLPNHSSTVFAPPPREPMPGPSHGYRGRGYIPHNIRGGRGGMRADTRPSRESGDGEDFIKKIRRLAEEIEVLRAEKMTQELLKKSAELADLMKYMSESGSSLTARQREPEYSPPPPPQHALPRSYHHTPRGPPQRIPRDSYDNHGAYENYYGQGYSPNPRWEGRRDEMSEDNYDASYNVYHQRGTSRTAPPSARGNHPRGKRGRGKFGGYGPYNGSNHYDQGPYGGQT